MAHSFFMAGDVSATLSGYFRGTTLLPVISDFLFDEWKDILHELSLVNATHDVFLVLIDSDDNCPKHFAPELVNRAKRTRPDLLVSIVLARREYEAWFLAAAEFEGPTPEVGQAFGPGRGPGTRKVGVGEVVANMRG